MQLRAYSANIRAFVTLLSEVFVLVPFYVCKRKIYLYNYGIYVWMTMAFVCVVYTTTTRGRQRLMCAWEILSKDCCTALPPRWKSPKIIVENVIFVVKPIMLCVCSDEIYIWNRQQKLSKTMEQTNISCRRLRNAIRPSPPPRRIIYARYGQDASAAQCQLYCCGVVCALRAFRCFCMYVGVSK